MELEPPISIGDFVLNDLHIDVEGLSLHTDLQVVGDSLRIFVLSLAFWFHANLFVIFIIKKTSIDIKEQFDDFRWPMNPNINIMPLL